MELQNIIGLFGLDGDVQTDELQTGHINRTFHVYCGEEEYILQSLNRSVFASPETVMENIAAISAAFERLAPEKVCIPSYLTAGGRNCAEYGGQLWRMYRYTPSAPGGNNAYLTGLSFGTFMRIVNTGGIVLEPVIEDFHSFGRYFARLRELERASAMNRIDSSIFGFLSSLEERLSQVFASGLPRRNIHGDAKSDNVIIGERCTVIDLDTAMESWAAIDFGDIVRSQYRGGDVDISAVRDAARGFAAGLDGLLTPAETETLYPGILCVTGELAVRYLIDGIGGYGYFKGKTPAGCLARADELLRQLRLYLRLEDELTETIAQAFGR